MAAPMSAQAARAMEQVKMGLYMLYGASYFTEEEWIKIDGLIHKGKYVFTSGPTNILDSKDEELMSFNDTNESQDLAVQENQYIDSVKEDTVVIVEREVDSPTESDRADSTDGPAETPSDTPAGASSDEEPAAPKAADPAVFDFSQWDTPAEPAQQPEQSPKVEETKAIEPVEPFEIPPREQVSIPSNGGLALGYTQAQLDEVKAFNQNLTKAGKKSKPMQTRNEPPSQSSTTVYAPTPSEHETRIQSWASKVDAQEPSLPDSIPSSAKPTTQPARLADEFVKTHGRPPKALNDVIQPNNPEFRPLDQRPASRAAKTTPNKPGLAPASNSGSDNPKLKVAAGTVLVAQSSQVKKSAIQIDVLSGDQLCVLKHVSGITHVGINLRSGSKGQFTENVFKKDPRALKTDALVEQQRMLAQQKMRTPSISSTVNGLDAVERRNAAEWDEVSVRHGSSTAASVKPKSLGGLANSRFAVLDDAQSLSAGSEQTDILQGMSREEISRLVDVKLQQIMAAQKSSASTSVPTGPLSRRKTPFNDPLTRVAPKTQTCWFWATPNKDCRFTADECRDLHEFLPPGSTAPANLRMGKPTWGALADHLPVPTTAQIQAQLSATPYTPTSSSDPSKGNKTCWYWANNDHCNYTAETCKYLHEPSPAGIASKPNSWKKNWSRWGDSASLANGGEPSDELGRSSSEKVDAPWRKDSSSSVKRESEEEEDEVEGELVLEMVGDAPGDEWLDEDDPRGWGESAQKEAARSGSSSASGANWGLPMEGAARALNSGWGDPNDRYKLPHIRALEEKALAEAVGW